MLPADQSESNFIDAFDTLMDRFQDWVKQEIVDDDPWDQESLYSDSFDSLADPADVRDGSSSDRS